MQYTNGRILVFAKAPVTGTVKTRLQPALSAEECCALHQNLVIHTLNTATLAGLCEIELWCTPNTSHPFFQDCKNKFPVNLKVQSGNNLGERMYHALQSALSEKKFAVLIGTDCPAIDKAYLEQACEILSHQKRNIVLGPAMDGGYVLIGAEKVTRGVFRGIQWGSTCVLKDTRLRLQKENLPWVELTEMRDIDRPEDLHQIPLFMNYPSK